MNDAISGSRLFGKGHGGANMEFNRWAASFLTLPLSSVSPYIFPSTAFHTKIARLLRPSAEWHFSTALSFFSPTLYCLPS